MAENTNKDYNQGTWNGRDQNIIDKVTDTQNILEHVTPLPGSEKERNESRLNDLVDTEYHRPIHHTSKEAIAAIANHIAPIFLAKLAAKSKLKSGIKSYNLLKEKGPDVIEDVVQYMPDIKPTKEAMRETAKEAGKNFAKVRKSTSDAFKSFKKGEFKEAVKDLGILNDTFGKTGKVTGKKAATKEKMVKGVVNNFDEAVKNANALQKATKTVESMEHSYDPVYNLFRHINMPDDVKAPLYKMLTEKSDEIAEALAKEKYLKTAGGKKRPIKTAINLAKKDPEYLQKLGEYLSTGDFEKVLNTAADIRFASNAGNKARAAFWETAAPLEVAAGIKQGREAANKDLEGTFRLDSENIPSNLRRGHNWDPSLEMTSGQKIFDNIKTFFDVNFSDNPRMYDMDVVDYLVSEINNPNYTGQNQKKWSDAQLTGLSDVEKLRFLRRVAKGDFDTASDSYSRILKNIYYKNKEARDATNNKRK